VCTGSCWEGWGTGEYDICGVVLGIGLVGIWVVVGYSIGVLSIGVGAFGVGSIWEK